MDASPGGLDWDEEPLFADEINSDDEDPPPLPPPMPPLSQLAQSHDRTPHTMMGGGRGGGGPDWAPTQGGATADGEQQGRGEATPTQKKRAPILTLTIDRMFSEKGLPCVEKEFPKLKFKGKGHEASDLRCLMQQYEHWANSMYPKLTFKDVTDRIEKLATKKEFKTQLIQMRRRWARGPTPPIPDDEDDDVTPTNNHHDNSPPENHHRSNSPTHQQIAGNSRLDHKAHQTPLPSSDSDSEHENSTHNLMNGDSCARDTAQQGPMEEDEWDNLLMRENDITRERDEQTRQMRKRDRDSDSSSGQEAQDTHNGPSNDSISGSVDTNKCTKRSKFSCEEDLEMEDLLAEEEQLMFESSDNHIPTGFEV